jgi:hypothetical protein
MKVRWHWGTKIALVYIAFASSTVGMVVIAMQQPVDLVYPDYYARSLRHDDHLAAVARTAALGDAFSIVSAPDGRAATITWPAAMAGAISGTVTLYRAGDARADRSQAVSPDANGRQQIVFDATMRGSWTLQVEWSADGERFYAERRLMVP